MYRIIGLDPGGTTGYAVMTWDDSGYLNWQQGHLGPQEHHRALYNQLGHWHVNNTIIVCESFEYRNASRPGLVLVSVEYIGVVKLFARERDVPLWFQTAAEGKAGNKTFVKKQNLEKLGLWRPGYKHSMDATAHVVRWVIHESMKHTELPLRELRMDFLQRGWK